MKKKLILAVALFLATVIAVPLVSAQVQVNIDPLSCESGCVALQSKNLRYRISDVETNGEVSLLQDFLQSKGYLNSEPTGYFGLMTKKAVGDFQQANGIEQTGAVGPVTRSKIRDVGITGDGEVAHQSRSQNLMAAVASVGCVSGGRYNFLTGALCSTSYQAPVVSVVTPRSGSMYPLNSLLTITWSPTTTLISTVELVSFDSAFSVGLYGPKYGNFSAISKGVFSTVISSTTPSGSYYVRLTPLIASTTPVVSGMFTIGQPQATTSTSTVKTLPTITVNKNVVASGSSVQFSLGKYPSNAAAWLLKVQCPSGVTAAMKATGCNEVVRFPNPNATTVWDAWLANSTYYNQAVTATFSAVDAYDRVIGTARAHVVVTPKVQTINYDACRLDKLDGSNITRNAYTAQSDCLSRLCDVYGPANLRATNLASKCMFNGTEIKRYQNATSTPVATSTSAYLTVLSPNGGEQNVFGEKDIDFRTTWSSKNLTGNVTVYLQFVDGRTCKMGTAPVSQGYYAAKVGTNYSCPNISSAIVAGSYKVLLVADNGNSYSNQYIKDSSDNYFTVSLSPSTTINYDACRLDKLDGSNITRNAYTVQSDCLSRLCDVYGPANLRATNLALKCVFNGTEIKRYQNATSTPF